MYISYHQDNYNTWLSLAEFPYNDCDPSSRTINVFHVYGRDPQFDSVDIIQDTPVGNLSTKIQSLQQDVKRELEVAINRSKKYADKSRASPPLFNPGDMVWLSCKNIKSTRPTKKTFCKMVGTFSISEESPHSCLPSQDAISIEVYPANIPYFTLRTSQYIKIPNSHQEPPTPIII
ncbi:hypothetical protein O181_110933 [Austropuccinia psidii MF-1]|uniref:Uncharacterized protein n=1 Tax=Austropuccinia psidii MF-1 TaxID=1389203 RepID=A0A9Q3PR98_9BASI|nr:hypothetical protein [Austropuccinia psidii MF-1]